MTVETPCICSFLHDISVGFCFLEAKPRFWSMATQPNVFQQDADLTSAITRDHPRLNSSKSDWPLSAEHCWVRPRLPPKYQNKKCVLKYQDAFKVTCFIVRIETTAEQIVNQQKWAVDNVICKGHCRISCHDTKQQGSSTVVKMVI